jgi:hypothetical protein
VLYTTVRTFQILLNALFCTDSRFGKYERQNYLKKFPVSEVHVVNEFVSAFFRITDLGSMLSDVVRDFWCTKWRWDWISTIISVSLGNSYYTNCSLSSL